jgi:hypothetical protein
MQPRHKEITSEKQQDAMRLFLQGQSAGIKAILNFHSPFKILIGNEKQCQKYRDQQQAKGQTAVPLLCGSQGHGNSHAGQKQYYCIKDANE